MPQTESIFGRKKSSKNEPREKPCLKWLLMILCTEEGKDSPVCRNSDKHCGFHEHYLFMKRLMGQEPTIVRPMSRQPNPQPETPEQLNLFQS